MAPRKKKVVEPESEIIQLTPQEIAYAQAQAVIDAVRAKYGKGAATRLSGDNVLSEVTEVIPTGIDVVDFHILGCGGLPVKRATEVYASEGAGKSSWLLHCMAATQRIGGLGIMAVTEEVDEARAEVFGVDTDQLIILQPDHIEECTAQAVDAIEAATANGAGPILFGWDSVAATQTLRELTEGLSGKDKVSDRAKFLSKAGRAFGAVLKKNRVHMMFINQVRDNIGVMFGDKFVTPGGHAIKFLAGARIQILGGKAQKDKEGDHTAKDVLFMGTKNKFGPPFRKARVRLDFEIGFDNEWSTLELAMDRKIIPSRSRGAKAYESAIAAFGWDVHRDGVVDPVDVANVESATGYLAALEKGDQDEAPL